jgi:hypothetical protein
MIQDLAKPAGKYSKAVLVFICSGTGQKLEK